MDLNKRSENKAKITLEDITRRKKEVLEEIRLEQEIMSKYTQQIFAPFLPADNSSVIKKFNTGLAVFDGFMTGMKLIKRVRKLFKKR